MKKNFFVIVFILLSINIYSQPYRAEKIKTSGVVVTKYSLCNDNSSYVEIGSVILMKDSSYAFVKHRDSRIIEDNPYLLKDLGGTIEEYERVFSLSSNLSIANDLSLSPFDSCYFSKTAGHAFVSAKDGFFRKDSILSDLFAVYNFEGVVVLYYGAMPFHIDDDDPPKEVWEEFGNEYNCGCPERENRKNVTSFVILLQTNYLSHFIPSKSHNLGFQHTNINLIPLKFCEM